MRSPPNAQRLHILAERTRHLLASGFSDQEALMADHAYPRADEHCRAHASCLQALSGPLEALLRGDHVDPSDLAKSFEQHAVGHFARDDSSLASFLKQPGAMTT
ncbi:hypothetical protein PAPYR_10383 [Paratrimastix pyriformis]|uniref:Hemerythrin-like domain-containing protein n=1 Tax=Paratrimastix pyriformis TaxID=342808 RepID=A0ABQ8U9V8_9EUKA|nr:hypothetical protein PAPYR_10383 [Paratrimastix pyriformis]